MNNASRIMDLTDKNITLKNQLKKQEQEIKRLHRRNREIYNEMKNFLDTLDIENYIKFSIFNHLGTYLLFNTPIRKSDK